MSATLSACLPPGQFIETAECTVCENPIPQQDIIITTPKSGLGVVKRQHVEAHCHICKHTHVFNRELTAAGWQRVGKIKTMNLREKIEQRKLKEADAIFDGHDDPAQHDACA
jgi:hypothetical protein